jgi:hypothetical protein
MLTQNAAVIFLAETVVPSEDARQFHIQETADIFDSMRSIYEAFLGERSTHDVPEILDDSVKLLLRKWVDSATKQFASWKAHAGNLNKTEIVALILDMNTLTRDMEVVVEEAERCSRERVHYLVLVNVCRAVLAFLWAVVTMYVVRNIWRLYKTTHATLQGVNCQLSSLLSSTFDAVVVIANESPFEVLLPSAQLDDIVGQPMLGKSILVCADDDAEKQRLMDFLGSCVTAHKATPQKQWCKWTVRLWSWLLLAADPGPLPIAHICRATWRRFRSHDSSATIETDVELELELAMVASAWTNPTLLALRYIRKDSWVPNVDAQRVGTTHLEAIVGSEAVKHEDDCGTTSSTGSSKHHHKSDASFFFTGSWCNGAHPQMESRVEL